MEKIGVVVLAAGAGTRMKSPLAKPLVPIDESTLVEKVVQVCEQFGQNEKVSMNLTFVVGHQADAVESYLSKKLSHLNSKIDFVLQEKMLGTADAVRTYFEKSKSPAECDHTLVLCADTPCLRSEDIGQLWTSLKKQQLKSVAATFCTDRPTGYGRIIRSDVGFNIVEEKDANSEQRLIKEVNAGVYFCETAYLKDKLMNIDNNNASGEFYLTDIFDSGQAVSAVLFESADSFIGVNDLAGLSKAYEIIRTRRVLEWTLQGVRFMDSSSTYIGPNVTFEAGSTIYPNTYFEGSSKIGAGVVVEPGCIIKDSQVGEGVHLKGYSYLESAEVSKDAVIGPYARLRPGSEIGAESKIGNFVEIKKAKLSQGVKVSHLSYVGDAEVGAETNIGCGFITCNYDGENKHLTKIGEGCFIGSDTQMIAPIEIGDKCYVASGSTINQSMPDGSFGISRGRQTTKEGLAKRFIKGSK